MKTKKTKLNTNAVVSETDDQSHNFMKKLFIRAIVGLIIAAAPFCLYNILDVLKSDKQHNYERGFLKTAKISRSLDRLTQTHTLWENVALEKESIIIITTCASGQFSADARESIEGLVEIRVFVNNIECSHNTVHSYNCTYRNDDRSISSAATTFVEKDKGNHAVRVEAVYYGNIQMHNTTAEYFILPKTTGSMNLLSAIMH